MEKFVTTQDYWALLVPEFTVSDLQKSLSFYLDTLGFTEKFARTDEGFSFIEMGQVQIMLEQITSNEDDLWLTAPLEFPFGRGINFQIEVKDVQTLHNNAVDAGCELFEQLETKWYRQDQVENGQTQFLIQDPDGYLLRFIQYIGTRPIS